MPCPSSAEPPCTANIPLFIPVKLLLTPSTSTFPLLSVSFNTPKPAPSPPISPAPATFANPADLTATLSSLA